MTEQTLLVLAALYNGELHGYAVAREVDQLSDGDVKLAAGTLYGALGRLLEQGLIAETREEMVGGRRRRYYKLTAAGSQALRKETARLRARTDALSSRVALSAAPRPRTT